MFLLVQPVLVLIPLKIRFLFHDLNIVRVWLFVNTIVWLYFLAITFCITSIDTILAYSFASVAGSCSCSAFALLFTEFKYIHSRIVFRF